MYSWLSSSMKRFHRWFSTVSEALKAMQNLQAELNPNRPVGGGGRLLDGMPGTSFKRNSPPLHYQYLFYRRHVFVHVVFRVLTCLSVRSPSEDPAGGVAWRVLSADVTEVWPTCQVVTDGPHLPLSVDAGVRCLVPVHCPWAPPPYLYLLPHPALVPTVVLSNESTL